MPAGSVNIKNLADNFLSFPYVIPDVLNPACCDFGDGNKPLTTTILIQRYEGYKILHILYSADNQFRFLRPFSVQHGKYHVSSAIISALILAFPPVGVARSCPQTTHFTIVLAFSNIVCSFSQSGHLTLKNLLRFSRISRTILRSLRQLKFRDPVTFAQMCLSAGNTAVADIYFFRWLVASGHF